MYMDGAQHNVLHIDFFSFKIFNTHVNNYR